MKYVIRIATVIILSLNFVVCASNSESNKPSDKYSEQTKQKASSLKLMQTILLPNVSGRIDHISVDIKGQRIFIAALGNNTVEVVNLVTGKVIYSIKDLHEPQGVMYVPENNSLYVANGGSGDCTVYDGTKFSLVQTIKLGDDADNIRYDSKGKKLYVGYGDGALGTINTTTNKRVGDIKLSGHPESFQLEQLGNKVFVNIPDSKSIAVISLEKQAVESVWPLKDVRANFPLALDETNSRLFVGCRNPATIVVFDTKSGKEVTRLAALADMDDIFYDSTGKELYCTGGEGSVYEFNQVNADNYSLKGKTSTSQGARTSLLIPELNLLCVAVPRQGNQMAEIRVFSLK
jgi:DNA-binding beta-propeller fold protein YncE